VLYQLSYFDEVAWSADSASPSALPYRTELPLLDGWRMRAVLRYLIVDDLSQLGQLLDGLPNEV
jgi:hypothetical protein